MDCPHDLPNSDFGSPASLQVARQAMSIFSEFVPATYYYRSSTYLTIRFLHGLGWAFSRAVECILEQHEIAESFAEALRSFISLHLTLMALFFCFVDNTGASCRYPAYGGLGEEISGARI